MAQEDTSVLFISCEVNIVSRTSLHVGPKHLLWMVHKIGPNILSKYKEGNKEKEKYFLEK